MCGHREPFQNTFSTRMTAKAVEQREVQEKRWTSNECLGREKFTFYIKTIRTYLNADENDPEEGGMRMQLTGG